MAVMSGNKGGRIRTLREMHIPKVFIHRCVLWRSWRLIEAAQGISNALPNDKSVLNGENEATYLAQQAKAFGFNIMRLFGLADVNYNEGSPLQSSPGALLCIPFSPTTSANIG